MGRSMRLGQCEVVPFEHLACMDEVNLINQFLQFNGLPILTGDMAFE